MRVVYGRNRSPFPPARITASMPEAGPGRGPGRVSQVVLSSDVGAQMP